MSTIAPALQAADDAVRSISQPDPPARHVVENRTSYRIGIRYDGGDARCLVLPPFGRRQVSSAEARAMKDELAAWTCRGLVAVRDEPRGHARHTILALLGLAVWSLPFAAVALLVRPSLMASSTFWTSLGALWGALLVGSWVAWMVEARKLQGRDMMKQLRDTAHRWVGMSLVLCVGIGVPGTLLWAQRDVLLDRGVPVSTLCQLLVAIFVVFVAVVATLPALLFFLFQQHRQESARTGFFREVMRIDPGLQTITDAEAIYGLAVDEAYGECKQGTLFNLALIPVLLSTLLMTLGWTAALLPTLQENLDRVRDFDQLALAEFLTPRRTEFTFAFLGAYFFTLNMVFRRYVRADLGPKAYSHISIRIIVAVVLAWVAAAIPEMGGAQAAEPAVWLLVFAFFVGIVPETGTALMHDFLRTRTFGKLISSLDEKDPLSNLEGITLYDRARLLEEGIENIENLAHHDLIDLMLRTRIPTPRVVDLVDQAILYLHVRDGADAQDPMDSLGKLRRIGVRTATDLLEAEQAVAERAPTALAAAADDGASTVQHPGAETGAVPVPVRADLRAAFHGMLGDVNGVPRLQMICIAIEDDEWMVQLKHWRSTRTRCDRIHTLADFQEETRLIAA